MRNQATGCAAKVESHIKGQSDKDQLVSSLLIGIERSHPSGQSVQKLDIIPDKPSSPLGIQAAFLPNSIQNSSSSDWAEWSVYGFEST